MFCCLALNYSDFMRIRNFVNFKTARWLLGSTDIYFCIREFTLIQYKVNDSYKKFRLGLETVTFRSTHALQRRYTQVSYLLTQLFRNIMFEVTSNITFIWKPVWLYVLNFCDGNLPPHHLKNNSSFWEGSSSTYINTYSVTLFPNNKVFHGG